MLVLHVRIVGTDIVQYITTYTTLYNTPSTFHRTDAHNGLLLVVATKAIPLLKVRANSIDYNTGFELILRVLMEIYHM